MRAIAALALAACGHATAPAEPPRAATIDASPPLHLTTVIDPDEELEKILPSHDPKYAKLSSATAIAKSALPAGPLPGAPALVVTRVPDPARCGNEDVIVRVDRSLPPPDPDFARAMTTPTPILATLYDLPLWMLLARARSDAAFSAAKLASTTASGQARIEAEARVILIERHITDAMLHMRPPVVPPPGAASTAFCEAIAGNMSFTVHGADDDARICHDDIAAQQVGTGWWDAICTPP